MELQLGSNSRCSLSSSAPWFWNVCGYLSSSPMRRASAVARLTCWAHRAACPRSGRLKRRAVPTEITLARVCREAGATVRRNVKLRDMNVHVDPSDERAKLR